MTIRLLLVDDHAVVRSGLKMLLENERDVEIVGEASSAAEAMESALRLKPTVILMDIGLPDLSGIDATREIKNAYQMFRLSLSRSTKMRNISSRCSKRVPLATSRNAPRPKSC